MDWNRIVNKEKGLRCAEKIADWIYGMQPLRHEQHVQVGSVPAVICLTGEEIQPHNWTTAFAVMGLLGSAEAFNNALYREAALDMGEYLKTLQVFNPFCAENYGAIREYNPQTTWCFTRDALSAAWAFIVLYKATGDKEYLERAHLWGEWYLNKGLDESGWPVSAVVFTPSRIKQAEPVTKWNTLLGYFQAGGLNYLKLMADVTGDQEWTGKAYYNIADMLVKYMQEPSGRYSSVEKATKKFPENRNHPFVRDDFASLGLLGAYKLSGNKSYLESVEKYLRYAYDRQREDGSFDKCTASSAVVLNITLEADGIADTSFIKAQQVTRAFDHLLGAQCDGYINRRMRGGLLEDPDGIGLANQTHLRGSGYGLLFLLKACAGIKQCLQS